MINVIVELSKYVILTLMVIYTFHCFYLVKQQSEEERNESLRQQLMLMKRLTRQTGQRQSFYQICLMIFGLR